MKKNNIGPTPNSYRIRGQVSAPTSKPVRERQMIKCATADKAVDLSKPETRRALSPTALHGFFDQEWRLDDDQMRGLLGGIARSTLHSWRRSADKRVLGHDTMTRISLVVGIYKALHTCFGDPGDYWITNPNNSPLFGGAVPIDYMN